MAGNMLRDLLAQIEAHGGPQALNLEGANLGDLGAGAGAIQAELARRRAVQPDAAPAWLSPRTGGLNLAQAILRRANLSDADLQGADLGEADLEGALLADAHLQAANLQRARLAGADLRDAHLEGANLAEATLDHAALGDAVLFEANLQGARLVAADLMDANLRKANLAQANLTEAILDEANLHQANLTGASLRAASLKEANLRQANLQGAGLDEAALEEADLRQADLTGASLRAAALTEADLRGAVLQGADLTGARLDEARLDQGRRPRRPRQGNWAAFAEEVCEEAVAGLEEWGSPSGMASLVDDIRAGIEQGLGQWTTLSNGPGVQPAGEPDSWSIPRDSATALHLSVGLGSVRLVGEARDDLRIRCSAGAREELEVARSEGAIHIRQREHHGYPGLRLDLELALPRAFERLVVRTGLGAIHGHGIAAQVRLATGKGDIRFEDSSLEGEVHTGSGNISLERVGGRVSVRAGNGDVRVHVARPARLAIWTARGNVRLEGEGVEEMRIHTGLGDVYSACVLGPGVCQVNTGAGVVTLELGEGQSAQVEASTGMGQVVSDWPLVRVGRPGRAAIGSMRMVGSIGGEEGRVTLLLKTGVGNIYLKRAAIRQAAPAEAEPVSPAAPPPAAPPTDEARLAILQSLARGEINAEEAEELLNGLIG